MSLFGWALSFVPEGEAMPSGLPVPPCSGLLPSGLFSCLTLKFSHLLDSQIGKKGRGLDAFFAYPVAQLFHVTNYHCVRLLPNTNFQKIEHAKEGLESPRFLGGIKVCLVAVKGSYGIH